MTQRLIHEAKEFSIDLDKREGGEEKRTARLLCVAFSWALLFLGRLHDFFFASDKNAQNHLAAVGLQSWNNPGRARTSRIGKKENIYLSLFLRAQQATSVSYYYMLLL